MALYEKTFIFGQEITPKLRKNWRLHAKILLEAFVNSWTKTQVISIFWERRLVKDTHEHKVKELS